ncbi:MAG TPA: succinylglutamate desuccinylase/aspartoacylase family protein [Rhodopila sp.]|uniref:succinylglutamate desuccinylase/aspartoacylase domain-containing protein n=1 Tax=Rhodopila sp. TaxID=2480087 RepID=UPI002BF36A09|nr:succinylglutamate desuccinylase/aspartoacylase family protein [Rhodopila sp.]HVY13825.1 succinylglutamate desuccinylase/aspartoacylase family protein [Rhodopila sp.]
MTPPLPEFKVHIDRPDIGEWLKGNTGLQGFTSFDSGKSGPHVALLALMHGNEIAGAVALDRLLRARVRPSRGRLTLGFVNLGAFDRFDPARPTASRFVDEDLNRVWDPAVLDGPRYSAELTRARDMRPFIEGVDVVLDLHSMLWPSEALTLCGSSSAGRALAKAIGTPPLIVADHGHVNGRRLIDYPRFSCADANCAAVLVEAGQHWEPATVQTMLASIAGLLRHLRLVDDTSMLPPPPASPRPVRVATVTMAVTAMTSNFAFVENYRGGDIIAKRNTLIAMDGETEIRTPHDNCLLVMPALRPSRGHTAVRLGRFEGAM